MKVAIMQPYFLPYIGYFQLINAVDVFIIYDNIEFTKKGWINRNRILANGKDDFFTLPLKKDSDFLDVNQRVCAETFTKDKTKIIEKINGLYKNAPQYNEVFPLIKAVFNTNERNLFDFIFHSLEIIMQYLEIKTEIVISSSINIDHSLKSQDKVIALCKSLEATHYLNPVGGIGLYSSEIFKKNDLQINFIKSNTIVYQQFDNEFIPWLSILDVLFFNSREKAQEYLNQYTIL